MSIFDKKMKSFYTTPTTTGYPKHIVHYDMKEIEKLRPYFDSELHFYVFVLFLN